MTAAKTPIPGFGVKGLYLALGDIEAEGVGEAQHGRPVNAVVQVILQEFLLQDHMILEGVLLLDNTQN